MIHPLHPAIVHFVIALFPISILLDILGLLTSRNKFHFAAWINLLCAGIAVLLAVGSGIVEENRVTIPDMADRSFEIHETAAFISASVIISLILWRTRFRNILPKKIRIYYLSIALVGIISLFIGTYHGGMLVYRYRIGPDPVIKIENESEDLFSGSMQVPIDKIFYEPVDSAR